MKKQLLMVIALLCTIAQGTWAESVTFNVRSWDEANKKVVITTETKDCYVLEGDHSEDWQFMGSADDLADHYYVVKGDVKFKTINVYGNAHLILADGATLTLTGGLKVEQDNNSACIHIYSQSNDDQEGRLVVTNSYSGAAGIGASEGCNSGGVIIHGGKLDITGGKCAPGIGAGKRTSDVETVIKGEIIIYGGTVKAHGGNYGAGIGGGSGRFHGNYNGDGKIYIYGGTVTATGGELAAGVGGGGAWQSTFPNTAVDGGVGQKVYVYGGTLTAQGGKQGAGIGGGSFGKNEKGNANGGTLEVYGGTVNATGGDYGAGIGGGFACKGATVNISGGVVNAKGGTDAAGIGGGEYGSGGVVTISGGSVRAEGTSYGAGIGGGECNIDNNRGWGNTVTITGGTVIAIAGNDCKGQEESGGSAIGCGQGRNSKSDTKYAGSLEIPDNYSVIAGEKESDIERVFTSSERIAACRWRNYVKIEACQHSTPFVGSDRSEALTYSIDDDVYHTKHCRYCNYTAQEEHSGLFCACGKTNTCRFTEYYPGTEKNTYVEGMTTNVGAGMDFYLPECKTIPNGYTFLGWEMNPDPEDGNEWLAVLSEDIMEAGASVNAQLGQAPAQFYPRFIYDFKDEWQWNDDYTKCTLKINCDALNYTYQVVLTQNDAIVRQYFDDHVEYSIRYTYTNNGYDYKFYTKESVPNVLILRDDTDNNAAIEKYVGKKASTSLQDHKFYIDGTWNPICLPFDVSENDFDTDVIEIKTLESSAFNSSTGTLTLNFVDADVIEAGKPYLIRWNLSEEERNLFNLIGALAGMTDAENNITSYEFEPAYIDNTLRPVETDYANFAGTFSPVSLTASDNSKVYLNTGNMLNYPTADTTIGACRTMFQLNGITMDEVKRIESNIGLTYDATPTGISTIGQSDNLQSYDEAIYDLSGRKVSNGKLSNGQMPKGIYIYKGKKIVM